MPIYEYRCENCQRRVSLLLKSLAPSEPPRCPLCGSERLARLFSRFAVVRSEEDRLERLADPGRFGDLDENDPKSVARFMQKMGKELGEDLGEDFDQAMEEAMAEGEGGGMEGAEE